METKAALLQAAEQSARTFGIDGFSFADLARAVGIRKASVHHHFPTKADLAAEMVRRYHEALLTDLDAIDAASDTAGQRLRRQIARYRFALGGGKTLCLCVALSAGRESLTAEAIDALAEYRQTVRAWLTEVFAKGAADGTIIGPGQPEKDAAASLALLEGAQLWARTEMDIRRFDDAVGPLLARII
ncbi:MAG: TetR/AcrR family transcriptional regulator [Rhodobacteraceae bacterium]|nr:TetR/AcrR family transcriptional regulator [Paracoccaceae bacterium]